MADEQIWGILKPTVDEPVFLIDLDRQIPLLTLEQFRDALLVGRNVQQSGD